MRNAFEAMATEATLKNVFHSLRELVARRQPALDAGDRMRVVTDASSVTRVTSYWGNFDTYPAWYSTGAPTAMDAREVAEEASIANFNQVRQQRWVL